jgi:MFS transporter, DHA2 family, multidrug resistance protein
MRRSRVDVCFMNTSMSLDYSGDQFFLPNLVHAVGQAMVITAIATLDIAQKDAANASGLFNMLRNLGGAIGTASLETIITKREQFHSNIIGQSVTLYRDEVRQRISEMTVPPPRRIRRSWRSARLSSARRS